MSTDHARDDWTDPRTEEALRRELDTLAGVGATSSGLDDALDGVRARVRRRRTIKQAGIGATTLVVAGGLVVGGATLLPEPDPMPGPAVTPSPTRTSSPDPTDPATPDDEPTAGDAVALVEDGYQPAWLQGTDLVCGMPADDLPAGGLRILDGPVLETVPSTDGTEEVPLWRAPTRLTLDDGTSAGDRVSAPTLLWAQDGRVVDVGIDTAEGGMDQLGDVDRERDAEDSTVTTCAPEHEEQEGVTRDTFTTELPAGEYEVRAFVTVWSPDYTRSDLVASEPVTVTVEDAGSGDGAQGRADCSAAGLDPAAPDLSELPAPVREPAEALLDAALRCDDAAMVDRAQADGTSTNFGGRTPAEFFTLPGAEEHEDVYANLVRLVADTRWSATPADDQGPFTYVWPRVATQEWAGSDEAWQEVVDAGLLDADEAAAMRGAEGYLGWRLGIHEDGTWQFFVAGD